MYVLVAIRNDILSPHLCIKRDRLPFVEVKDESESEKDDSQEDRESEDVSMSKVVQFPLSENV